MVWMHLNYFRAALERNDGETNDILLALSCHGGALGQLGSVTVRVRFRIRVKVGVKVRSGLDLAYRLKFSV